MAITPVVSAFVGHSFINDALCMWVAIGYDKDNKEVSSDYVPGLLWVMDENNEETFRIRAHEYLTNRFGNDVKILWDEWEYKSCPICKSMERL